MEGTTELLGLFLGVLENRILGLALLLVRCCAVEGGGDLVIRLKKLSDGACDTTVLILRAHDPDDVLYMLVRPDAGVIMQQREIRNRAHGHESIEVLNFAARVPKGFAGVYSDVQHGLRKARGQTV